MYLRRRIKPTQFTVNMIDCNRTPIELFYWPALADIFRVRPTIKKITIEFDNGSTEEIQREK